MEQRLSFITLAVADPDKSKRFYVDGLGWEPAGYEPGEVLFLPVADRVVLSLWSRSGFEEEVGQTMTGPGFVPITLAHNVATTGEVDEVLETAIAAGATLHAAAAEREWGGYSGYFRDLDDYCWEIAYNPGEIGRSVLPD